MDRRPGGILDVEGVHASSRRHGRERMHQRRCLEGAAVGTTVVCVNVGHPAARAFALAAEADGAIDRVVGVGYGPVPLLGPKTEVLHRGHAVLETLTDVAAIALFPDLRPVVRTGSAASIAGLLADVDEALRLATSLRASRVVLWSSAAVYGAFASNQVPLREDAAVGAHAFAPARALLEAEAKTTRWAQEGREAVLLRPAGIWSAGWTTDATPFAEPVFLLGVGDSNPAVQALHEDDAVAALALAMREPSVTGVCAIAPADWLCAREAAAAAGCARSQLPAWAATGSAAAVARLPGSLLTPGAVDYHMHPWVVASERLLQAGWAPNWTTAEALAGLCAQGPGRVVGPVRLQPRRLAQLAGVALAGASVAAATKRWRRSP